MRPCQFLCKILTLNPFIDEPPLLVNKADKEMIIPSSYNPFHRRKLKELIRGKYSFHFYSPSGISIFNKDQLNGLT